MNSSIPIDQEDDVRIRCGPLALLIFGIFCGGTPGPTLAQPPNPRVAEKSNSLPKIVARLGSTAFDLMEHVACVAWSPDGRSLASASESTTRLGHFQIDFWNAETGERIWRTESQVQKVRSLQFSADGRAVIEAGSETTSAMDATTGKRVPVPMSAEADVSAQLIGDQQKILVKHPQAGKQNVTIVTPKEKDAFLSFRFSPDRRSLATGSRSGDLILWNVEDGRRIRDFDIRVGQISSLEFTPDGKLLIAAGAGQSLYVFQTETGRQRFRLDDARGHTLLAVDPQGKRLASAQPLGGTVCLWNLENGRREHTIERPLANVAALAFAPDGKRIALAGRAGARSASLSVWNVESGKETIPLIGHVRPVTKLAFSSDSRFLATFAFDGTVCLWNVQTGDLVSQFEADASSDLRFSPDGWLLGAASVLGSYWIWEVSSGDLLVKRDAPANLRIRSLSRFSPELDLLALAAPQGEVWLVETSTGQTLPAMQILDKHEVGTLAFSSDGRMLAVGSGNPRDHKADRGLVAICDVTKREKIRELQSPPPLEGRSYGLRFEDLTFSADGGTLAARHSGLRIEFWLPDSGLHTHEVSIPKAKPLAFLPRSQVLVLLGDPVEGSPQSTGSRIELMEVATGGVFQNWDIPHRASAFAVSPDGRRLALALKDSRQVLVLSFETPSATEPTPDPALADAVKDLTMEEGQNFRHFVEQFHLAEAVENLTKEDAKTGRAAMAVLLAAGEKSVGLLEQHLQPDGKPEGFDQRVQRLIRELDDDNFFVRERASNELAALGQDAVPALNEALETKPPLEVEYRIRRALKSSNRSAEKLTGQSLRRIRAIELLERIGTTEAESLLTSLGKQPRSPREASAIRLALKRIQKSSP